MRPAWRAGALLALATLAGCGGKEPAGALCAAEPLAIHAIQGAGEQSPRVGERVVVHGVVTARFAGDDEVASGLFLQSLPGAEDDRRDTSEGLFVAVEHPAEPGERLGVSGTVRELGAGATALVDARIERCGENEGLPEPLSIDFPANLASFENMLVSIAGELTFADLYHLGRYGSLVVASGGMLYQPTELAPPGPEAERLAATNASRRLRVDDGSRAVNPGQVDYLPEDVSIKTLPRTGDRLGGLVGVIDRREGERLHALRRLEPASRLGQQRFTPPAGEVSVATLNLQNYFNGDGLGGGFPAPRGASSAEEFQRQEAKLVAAILGLGLPDIVALQELENDGFGPTSAVASLTAAVNGRIRSPRATYRYVRLPGDRLGSDEITVGLLYRHDKVRLAGPAATLTQGPFAELSRPPLAQTFEATRSAERFTVVALHLKSKGCRDAVGADLDQGDGQGCFNASRVAAAERLLAWIATDPTGSGDADFLLIGDLNAYSRETPLRVLEAAGYENLVARFAPGPRYTFIYDGAAGSLDHALASASLAGKARGARIWHVNAPYPSWLDYNLEGKPEPLASALYKASAVRSSDHDPLVVSFRE